MNTTSDPLAQLRDIHAPPPLSSWPPPLGYWLLFFLCLFLLCGGFYVYFKGRRFRAFRKNALFTLNTIKVQFEQTKNTEILQTEVAALLRRILLSFDERAQVAKKPFIELLPKLRKMAPHMKDCQQMVELIDKERYKKEPSIDGSLLLELTHTFIRKCKL